MDENTETRYRKLAEHRDQLPEGFATSETGADLRLLRRLFTPEPFLETWRTIALDRADLRLDKMIILKRNSFLLQLRDFHKS